MLLLTAPAQHIAQNPAVECDPRRVRHWLDGLSDSDVQSTVSELIAALRPFNELQLEIRARLKLLETYHGAFETILYTYDDMHLRALALDQAQRRKLSDDIMWVYLELANGYKSIVKAVYDGSNEAPVREEVQLSIYRSIELLAQALLYAFRDHQTPPPLVYLELHQLYYLAEQYELQAEPITSVKRQARNPTIEHLYKRIMLLIAGNAYGYDGSQINELYELLENYTEDCRLLKSLDESALRGGYFIDFTEDEGPRSVRGLTFDKLLAMQRILDVGAAITHIVADLNAARAEPAASMRGAELRLLRLFVQNLHQATAVPAQIQSRRDRARVAYGAESVAYYLVNRERFIETPEESVNGIEVRDIDMFEAEHELLEWEVADVTPTGRVLLATAQDNVYLRVGKLLSIVENIGTARDTLVYNGLIRWLRQLEDKVLLGVEFLSGMPTVVSCQGLDAQDGEVDEFNALYFPSNKDTRQPASLLFEYEQFRAAGRFRVEVSGQQYNIEPVKILRESPVHIQFSFRVVKPA